MEEEARLKLKHAALEFTSEDDVVIRNSSQMKKIALKNVEGMVSVKGFIDEKTQTVTVVGGALCLKTTAVKKKGRSARDDV